MLKVVDAIIIGGGPVGLLLATELALQRISVVVFERLLQIDQTIKAGGLKAVGIEALARRGLGPQINEITAAEMAKMKALFASSSAPPKKGNGGHFAGLTMIDQSADRVNMLIQQASLEEILNQHAKNMKVDLRRGYEFVNYQQAGDKVTVTVKDADGKESSLDCSYLIGCDGGRSMVRKAAGIDFPGTASTLTGRQAVVTLDDVNKLQPFGWRSTETGIFAYGPMPGRVMTLEFDGPPADRTSEVTFEEVQASLRRVSGTDVTITSMTTATRWTDNTRMASTYRKGRVFLAGDAAHVHAPFGGQGLSLGFGDALNLGWKLASTLRGTAPSGLLDTYHTERHPAAAAVVHNTRAQTALMRPDPQTSALRDIFAHLLGFKEVNGYIGGLLSGLDVKYPLPTPSEILNVHPLVGLALENLLVVQKSDGKDIMLYDLMHGGKAVLIDLTTDGAFLQEAKAYADKDLCVSVAASKLGNKEEFSGMLLRPDGIVAWVNLKGVEPDISGLKFALNTWLGAL